MINEWLISGVCCTIVTEFIEMIALFSLILRHFVRESDKYKYFHRVQRLRKYRVTCFLSIFSTRENNRNFESLQSSDAALQGHVSQFSLMVLHTIHCTRGYSI